MLMAARACAYAHGILPSWHPSTPCICVGNISWGGTGKTPMVSWLLDWAEKTTRHAAVLTRGYHAAPPHLPFHVQADSLPSQSGDEPLMLAQTHARADIIVDPKRIRSGPWAERNLHPDLFILDDGFQHLAARRHLDLVLLSPADLGSAWGRVIPAGSWREGPRALRRAQAFIVNTTGASLTSLMPLATRRLGHLATPVFFAHLVPTGLRHLATGEKIPHLNNAPYFLFTGIANPRRVIATATELMGTPPTGHLFFPDHHAFTPEDLACIHTQAKRCGAQEILCTPKDGIKIIATPRDSIWQIETRFSFTARQNTSLRLEEYLEEKLQAR